MATTTKKKASYTLTPINQGFEVRDRVTDFRLGWVTEQTIFCPDIPRQMWVAFSNTSGQDKPIGFFPARNGRPAAARAVFDAFRRHDTVRWAIRARQSEETS